MKARTLRKIGIALGILCAIIIYLLILAVCVGVVWGFIKLVTWCFGLSFSIICTVGFILGLGIWLSAHMLKSNFSNKSKK